jgi:hypothetical protein
MRDGKGGWQPPFLFFGLRRNVSGAARAVNEGCVGTFKTGA